MLRASRLALRQPLGLRRHVLTAPPRPARLTLRVAAAHDTAKNGDFVAVHYTGTLDDDSVFDSSRDADREPLEFIVGAGKVIKGFDKCVMGLAVGESRKLRVSPAEAYGEKDPSMVLTFPAAQAPQGLVPGVKVQLSNGMLATVKEVTDENVMIDMNPPLAGEHLTFDVELMQLCPAERLQRATFAAGCFWGPELAFQRVPGVLSTEVGYCNGNVPNPSYEDVCTGETGHAEVVQVLYDPAVVSYGELLDVFWERHDPTTPNRQGNDVGSQYRSGIYYHTQEQQQLAQQSVAAVQSRYKNPVVTEVAEISLYSAAEPYHQQYLSRGGRSGSPQSPKKKCNDPIRCYG